MAELPKAFFLPPLRQVVLKTRKSALKMGFSAQAEYNSAVYAKQEREEKEKAELAPG